MAWFKWYENAVTDAKIQCVAKISGQPVAYVIAVWVMILERASEADVRGDISGFDCESADAALQMPEGAGCAIYKALEAKDMISNGRVVNWDKRQATRRKTDGSGQGPKSNAERQRAYRERQKTLNEFENSNGVTKSNGNVTDSNVTRNDVTQRNVTSNERCNGVTKSNALKDKIRIDKIKNLNTPPIPPASGGSGMENPKSNSQPNHEEPEPSMEFTELRSDWDEHMRVESPRAGFKAYLAAKRRGDWPGLHAIRRDVMLRQEAGFWNSGYEPGLDRYISERTWLAPVVSRASPAQKTYEEQAEERYQKLLAQAAQRDAARERGEAV